MKLLAATAAAATALLAFTAPLAHAADLASPVGLWQNIDDETNKPKALIRITDSNGVLQGQIEKLYRDAGEDQNPLCVKCEGARKDQPITGMVILTGLKKDGDEYTGGEILDPAKGKTYKSKMHLTDGGKKLSVRGYIGTPMLGRSKTWVRQD
ncbi:UNVERIFIED_ORG: uncharacterized protein (DUF2147 family) [Zoogloea ramigera]|uniref:DUF2147 domain-containing protein n=1 Tax=Duganella zoogloeoides TaxID=75659 RepID=A0ABZ0Y1C5_9BURK|nr:DUF2147 domain-containing protein [Duganella zoogloeoides]WQH05212.1 DUF2147 domain-containing protein [Duganella zoogloeoides]